MGPHPSVQVATLTSIEHIVQHLVLAPNMLIRRQALTIFTKVQLIRQPRRTMLQTMVEAVHLSSSNRMSITMVSQALPIKVGSLYRISVAQAKVQPIVSKRQLQVPIMVLGAPMEEFTLRVLPMPRA